tara:strand:- start:68 stop:253 length:186 start_codon:yes stop_codon:yes gene_type:complete
MIRPTTEELKSSLEQLVNTYNEALQTQQNCKEAIIATKAVLQDRELENGDTNSVTSNITED